MFNYDRTATAQKQIARRERRLLLIAAAFLSAGTFTLATGDSSLSVGHCALVIFTFAISFTAAHVFLNRYLPHRDPPPPPVPPTPTACALLLTAPPPIHLPARQTI